MANKTAESATEAPSKPVAEMTMEERGQRLFDIAQTIEDPDDPELNEEIIALLTTPKR